MKSSAGRERGAPENTLKSLPRIGTMNRVFTSFLRSFHPQTRAVDQELFESAWEALQRLLAREIHKRGLWGLPPSYLGIYGYPDWSGSDASSASGEQSALRELTAECFVFVFIDRLDSLRAQLGNCRNIDGFVVLNVRNFVYERQKAHDPLGSRVFKVLRSAVRAEVADRKLHVLAGDPKILGSTVLGFDPQRSPEPSEHSSSRLAERAERWNDDLLPELITTRGRGHHELQGRLRERLRRLEGEVDVFFFKDLIRPLKSDARHRWATVWDREQGETAIEDQEDGVVKVVSMVRPDTAVEDRDHFRKLVDCIDLGLLTLEIDRKTRRYLGTLWHFLILHAAEAAAVPQSLKDPLPEASLPDGDRLPSQRKTASLLKIPRERLPGLYGFLRQLAEGCLGTEPAGSGHSAGME